MTTMNNEDPADPSVHEPRIADAELPEPVLQIRRNAAGQVYLWAPTLTGSFDSLQYVGESFYTADQMRDYAAAAVATDRSRRFLKERGQLEQEWSVLRGMAAAELPWRTHISSVEAGFKFNAEAATHTPTVLVRFEPVAANAAANTGSWPARDAFAKWLMAAKDQPK